jgi:hypothetical protein
VLIVVTVQGQYATIDPVAITLSDGVETWTKLVQDDFLTGVNPRLATAIFTTIATSTSSRTLTATTTGTIVLTIQPYEIPNGSTTITNYVFLQSNGGTSLTTTLPSAPAAGSYRLAGFHRNGGGTQATPAGETQAYGYVASGRQKGTYDITSPTQSLTWVGAAGTQEQLFLLEIVEASAGGGRTGSAAITDDNDTVAGTGTVAGLPPITGSASITDDNDTLAATAKVAIRGAGAVTDDNDTVAATGTLTGGPPITGTASITDDNDTLYATGTSGAVIVIPPGGGGGGGGSSSESGRRKRRQWIRGAPYPWQKQEDEDEDDLEKVKVTLPLVEEALEEIATYEGLPGWWHLQNPKIVKQRIPDFVWVPDNEAPGYDHQAVLAAIMTQIAEELERDDEEAIVLLLS